MDVTSVQGLRVSAAQASAFEISGRRYDATTPGLADAVADAYADRLRPRCLCRADGVAMYIARLAGLEESYIVKRMPGTGNRHAPDCPSYEPPPQASGLEEVLGSAVSEDPATGETTLRLDFPLSKMPGRSVTPSPGDDGRAASDGTRLSLRALLHHLWDRAELTRWHPGFAGRRNWGTVRHHLLRAAEHNVARGVPLRNRLYVPEVFATEKRDAINARRLAQWRQAQATPGRPQHLMLLIGEVKEVVSSRYGYKVVVKHVPDQGFALDSALYRRLGRRLEPELALWSAADDIHMIMIATFGVSAAGVPSIEELSLMPVTREWLPIAHAFDKQLVDRLVTDGRTFVKGLRYNLAAEAAIATATLTDCGEAAPLLFVLTADHQDVAPDGWGLDAWTWRPQLEPMPPLPPAARCVIRWKAAMQGSAKP